MDCMNLEPEVGREVMFKDEFFMERDENERVL